LFFPHPPASIYPTGQLCHLGGTGPRHARGGACCGGRGRQGTGACYGGEVMYKGLKKIVITILFCLLVSNCGTTDKPVNTTPSSSVSGIGLSTALKNAALDIKERVPKDYILALVNFSAISTDFSQYLIDELTSKLIEETGLKIVERKQLELVQNELNFQMSGDVSEETAKSIGKFVGADTIITGTFMAIGNKYRLGVKTIHVETGLIQSLYITDVINDQGLISIIRSLNNNNSAMESSNLITRPREATVSFNYDSNKIDGHDAIISPDGKWIITATSEGSFLSDKKINIYDIMNGNLLRAFPLPYGAGYVDSLTMSTDGKNIAASYDNYGTSYVIIYDVLTGRKNQELKFKESGATCLCLFNPSNNQLVVAAGNLIYLFDLATRKERSVYLNTWRDFIKTIQYSFNGSYLAVGDYNGTITILDAKSLKIIGTLKGHSEAIKSLAFNPDNTILISGSSDYTVGIWDLRSGKELLVLTEHLDAVNSVLFKPDGKIFLSSANDGTAKIYDALSYSVIKSLKIGSYADTSLSPDGNYFITNFGNLYKFE
jgi:WD40 repeat protein